MSERSHDELETDQEDETVIFEERPATTPLPSIIEGMYGHLGSESHCAQVHCRWPCWHHIHDVGPAGDLIWDFECYGDTMRMFADQGCATCALLRHQCKIQLDGFCSSDCWSVVIDGDRLIAEAHLECRHEIPHNGREPHVSEPTLIDLCTVEFRRPAGFAKRSSYSRCLNSNILPLHPQPGTVHDDPKAEPAVHLFRNWYEECANHHVSCPKRELKDLPSRVLDVRDDDVVRLRPSSNLEGSYIALSYCWGGRRPPRTTKANRNEHENGVPYFSLPATYRDAVFIARKLSIPFLWIDALCIIQDDDEDRTFELGKMARTFRNADLVLIAASAKDPFQGFLHRRGPGLSWSSPTVIKLANGQSQMVVSRKHQETHRQDACQSTIIDNRAWTLQERLLARRCLIFNESECIWECREGCKCECQTSTGGLESQLLPFIDQTSPIVEALAPSPDQFWKSIVSTQYSERQLSVASDRLPAIGAVAQYVASITHDQYIAGIWRRDMIRQLAWLPSANSLQEDRLPRASTEYIAPSWSWVSSMERVAFLDSEIASPNYEATILEAVSEVSPNDPFGAVRSAHIIMKGFASSAQLTLETSHDKHLFSLNEGFDIGPYGTTSGLAEDPILFPDDLIQKLYFPDGSKVDIHNSRPCQRLVSIVEQNGQPPKVVLATPKGPTPVSYELQDDCSGEVTLFWISEVLCLVLVPSPRVADAFERLGLVELYTPLQEDRKALVDSEWPLTESVVKIV